MLEETLMAIKFTARDREELERAIRRVEVALAAEHQLLRGRMEFLVNQLKSLAIVWDMLEQTSRKQNKRSPDG